MLNNYNEKSIFNKKYPEIKDYLIEIQNTFE
jgi:hypothetical protein